MLIGRSRPQAIRTTPPKLLFPASHQVHYTLSEDPDVQNQNTSLGQTELKDSLIANRSPYITCSLH